MRRLDLLAAGVLLLTLALVTVAVQVRVVRLRQQLAAEVACRRHLEAETALWYWRLRWWRTPAGTSRLAALLGRNRGSPSIPVP